MKHSKKTLFLVILLPIQYFLVQFLSQKPIWIERYYSNGVFPIISKVLRTLLGWIPFSVGDVLGFILLFVFFKNLIKLVLTKFTNFVPKTLKFIAFLSVIYFCFYAFWGLNYFREPLSKNLGLQQSEYTTEELYKTSQKIVTLLNQSHSAIAKNDSVLIVVPYTSSQLYKMAPQGFDVLARQYPQLAFSQRSTKSSIVSILQSYNGTSGYINPITGEAQVNYQIPKTGFPTTICHEMAHQIGWAAENDANFVGFLAAINHEDPYFKYAGYRMAFQYCLGELHKRDKELLKELKKTVNKGVFKDYKNSFLFWQRYENPIEPYLKKGYSSYLKANNQAKGIDSYSYVVDLLIAYYKN